MEKFSQTKSKIPMVRPTKSSILLTNYNSTKSKDPVAVPDEDVVEQVGEPEEVSAKVRRRWKSVVHAWDKDVTQMYSIREWRDDYSDNLSVEKLLDISQDLLEGIDSNQVGEEERDYRYEQSVFWLIKAAERGSKTAISRLEELVISLGKGVNERTWNEISPWLSSGSKGDKLGFVAFRKLDNLQRGFLTVGQLHRSSRSNGFITDKMCAKEIRIRAKGDFEDLFTQLDLVKAGKLFWSGHLPQFQLNNSSNSFSNSFEERNRFHPDVLLCKLQQITSSKMALPTLILLSLVFSFVFDGSRLFASLVILSQVLYQGLFNSPELRQFILWSKIWSVTCKLSSEEEKFALEKFKLNNAISHYLRIVPCLFFILESSNQNSTTQKVFFCTAGIQLLFVISKLTFVNFFLILIGILPLVAPHLSQVLIQHTESLWISTYLWILSDQHVWTLTITTSGTLILSTRSFLSLDALSFLAFFNLSFGNTDFTWTGLLAASGLFFALTKNIQRFKSLAIFLPLVGVIVSNLFSVVDSGSKVSPPQLTWQNYHQACPANADISGQLLCSNFIGKKISWEGKVSQVSLKKKPLIWPFSVIFEAKGVFPGVLGTLFTQTDSSCSQFSHEFQLPCNAWQESLHLCSIQVEMSKSIFVGNSQKIEVISSNMTKCKNLKAGHMIQFEGNLGKVCSQTEVRASTLRTLS